MHANWIMNSTILLQQGPTMWQGVMKTWSIIQSGLEQQDPMTRLEISRQTLNRNRLLINEMEIQWGIETISNMLWWAEKGFISLQNLARPGRYRWKTFTKLEWLKDNRIAQPFYARVVQSIPWEAQPMPTPGTCQWLALLEETTLYIQSSRHNPLTHQLLRCTTRNPQNNSAAWATLSLSRKALERFAWYGARAQGEL